MESELAELRSETNSALIRITEVEELMRFLNPRKMKTEYDEELFIRLVDHIVVNSQTEIEFVLKCGLRLREEL